MRVLNLYSGTGGNRRLWKGCEVTAIENNNNRADMYSKEFPNDTVIVTDAHQYLLDNYRDFDFVWSSPPCQTHSRANYFINEIAKESRYPDMSLWQEIIFLNQFCKGKWVVENVIPYYDAMFNPKKIGRHCFWSNFIITSIPQPKDGIGRMNGKQQPVNSTTQEERNEVNPGLGLHIFNLAKGIVEDNNKEQTKLEL